jgi:RHS repeat-associated protein
VSQLGFGATSTTNPIYQNTLTYTYDIANRVTDVADSLDGGPSLTLHRDYDDLDRVTAERQAGRGTVNYTYYPSGRRQTMEVPGQPTLTYTYDNADRLTKIDGGAALGIVQFTYEGHRPKKVTLANGVDMTYAFDEADQLKSIVYSKGVTTLGNLSYEYDRDGRRTAIGGSLAQVVLPGAVASTNYNNNNQLLQWAGQNYTYDNNGNVWTDGSKTFVWNSRDQLTGLTGGVTASFGYDGFGRRISKTVASAQTGYVYDGLNFVQELAGASVKANLVTGLGLDEVYQRKQGLTASHVLSDALGSTLGLTDANGLFTTTYAYEPYGNTTTYGASNENAQRYTGREDDATGLMYYRARYYIPNCGRFASEDPIGIGGGMNEYQYVTGSPLNLVDPLGLWSFQGGGGRPPHYFALTGGCSNGSAFGGFRFGPGGGAHASVDFTGQLPHQRKYPRGLGSGFYIGGFASFDVSIGPFWLGWEGRAGFGFDTNRMGFLYADVPDLRDISFGGKESGRWGAGGAAALGVDVGGYSHGSFGCGS